MQDGEIVDLYWQRNESAIEETDKKYGKYLFRIADNILFDREDSKECVNDTYLKAWNAMPPNRPGVQERPGTTHITTESPESTHAVPEKPERTPAVPEHTITPAPDTTEKPQGTDWESKWAYFIARLEGEEGEGLPDPVATESPSWPEPGETEEPMGDIKPPIEATAPSGPYSDEYFIEHSYWIFNLNYAGGYYIARKSALAEGDVERYLGKVNLDICEQALLGLHLQEELPAYSIKNVSTKAAIAVCVSPGEYYLFVNMKYAPGSLKEFLTDFNLISTARLKKMAAVNQEDGTPEGIRGIRDEAGIWSALLSYDSSVIDDFVPEDHSANMKFEMDNDFYSYYHVVFTLYDEGYIYFEVMGYRFAFLADQEMISRISEIYGND